MSRTPNVWNPSGGGIGGGNIVKAVAGVGSAIATGISSKRGARRQHEMHKDLLTHEGDVAVSVAQRLSGMGGPGARMGTFKHRTTSASWVNANDNQNTGEPSAHTAGNARHPRPQFVGMPGYRTSAKPSAPKPSTPKQPRSYEQPELPFPKPKAPRKKKGEMIEQTLFTPTGKTSKGVL